MTSEFQVPLQNISDIELSIRTSSHIESVLVTNFKASGSGLHGMLTSAVRNYNAAMAVFNITFPNDLQQKICQIANIRNHIVRKTDCDALRDRDAFVHDHRTICSALQALYDDTLSKDVQIVSIAQQQPVVVIIPQHVYQQPQMMVMPPQTQIQYVQMQRPEDSSNVRCIYLMAFISFVIPLIGFVAMCAFHCGRNMRGRRRNAFIVLCITSVLNFLYYLVVVISSVLHISL
eukprot:929257_1